jgi:hypothetical protein
MNEQEYIRDASTNYLPALVEPAHSSRREQVRWRVRHLNLCALDRETRKDAAADPGIEWCPVERQYRIRRRGKAEAQCASPMQYLDSADPRASAPASAPAGLDIAGGEGASGSSEAASLPTGAGHELERSDRFSIGEQ